MNGFLAIALLLFSTTYASLTSREIKALSEEDVRSLREGKGMGLALAAELNSYPGPRHVLELAETLRLTAKQKRTVQRSHDRMLAAAVALGNEIVELERGLDREFAARSVNEKRLAELTAAIALKQGRLRYVHLAAHLETRAALTADQIKAYDASRGYGSAKHSGHGHHGVH